MENIINQRVEEWKEFREHYGVLINYKITKYTNTDFNPSFEWFGYSK